MAQWWEAPPPKQDKSLRRKQKMAGAATGTAVAGGLTAGALLLSRGRKAPTMKTPKAPTMPSGVRIVPKPAPSPKRVSYRPVGEGKPREPKPGESTPATSTAPMGGRSSSKSSPVGPNVPKSSRESAMAGQQASQVRANRARLIRRNNAATESKRINEQDLARLVNPKKPPRTADGDIAKNDQKIMSARVALDLMDEYIIAKSLRV